MDNDHEPKEETDSVASLAETYRGHVRRSNRGHYSAAERAQKMHRLLGVSTALASAALGTSILATINDSPSTGWRIAAGLVALAAATLATLETTLRYSNQAAEHRNAGAAYGRLRRQFDLLLVDLEADSETAAGRKHLERLVEEIDSLGEAAPLIPPSADVESASG